MGLQNQKVPAAVQVGEHTDLADWADIPGTEITGGGCIFAGSGTGKAAVWFLIDFFIVKHDFHLTVFKFYCSRNCFFSGAVNSNFKFTDRQI